MRMRNEQSNNATPTVAEDIAVAAWRAKPKFARSKVEKIINLRIIYCGSEFMVHSSFCSGMNRKYWFITILVHNTYCNGERNEWQWSKACTLLFIHTHTTHNTPVYMRILTLTTMWCFILEIWNQRENDTASAPPPTYRAKRKIKKKQQQQQQRN